MILPTPGADPASRLHGWADPDGAGPIGPDQAWPQKVDVPFDQVMNGLNPLHYVPVVGMVYRAATGEQIPATMRVMGAAITGGPLGALGAGLMGLLEAIFTMEPDQTRPAVPAGMSATGSEAAMEPVSPGELAEGAYTTLATVTPEWLGGATQFASRGAAAYSMGVTEWQRTQALEKGLA